MEILLDPELEERRPTLSMRTGRDAETQTKVRRNGSKSEDTYQCLDSEFYFRGVIKVCGWLKSLRLRVS
jgi:hypothetical protein